MDPEQQSLSIGGLLAYARDLKAWVLKVVLFLLLTAKKNILVLLLVAAAAGSFSYYLHRNDKALFDVKMSCIFFDNHQRTYGEMLHQLNQLIQSGATADAAALLGMQEDQISKIATLYGTTMSGGRLEEDFSDVHYAFYVYANVYDRSVTGALEKGILNYLNNNNQSVTDHNKKKMKWQSRVRFYEQQLAKLDSLKEAIRISYLQGQNTTALAQKENSVVDIYKLSDTLSFNMADMQYYADHYESVTKVYGFMPRLYPSAPDKRSGIIKSSLAALIAAWLLLGLLGWIRAEQRKELA